MIRLNGQWKSTPEDYRMDTNAVHVWRAYFELALVSNRKFVESISEEETERAQRFVRQSDRDRYVFAHGMLRSILGTYVGCAPQKLLFADNQYHKPFLEESANRNDLQFNLSHSEDLTLIAVSRGTAVGIDVERMRRIPDALQIVNRFFSLDERRYLNSLPPAEFEEGFFACWTAKEAFLKGIGKGLSHPLENFSIILSNGESVGLVNNGDDSVNAYSWKIVRLSPGPDYAGALAVEGLRSEVKYFEWCLSRGTANCR